MNRRFAALSGLLLLSLCTCVKPASGQQPGIRPLTEMPSVINVPSEAQPSDHFDAEAATSAYLAQIPTEATARSNAYFEGGYWLLLWDFLVGAVICILLLQLRCSAALRNFRRTHYAFQTPADIYLLG
jgi:STE24 endopeptidase